MNKSVLAPGIVVYKNVLPQASNIIKLLENAASKEMFFWAKGSVVKEKNGMKFDVADEKIRDVDTFQIPFFNQLLQFDADPEEDFDAFVKLINNYVYEPLKECMDDYRKEYGIEDFVDQDSYQFLKYGEGQFFNNHMDDCLKYHRRISYSMYLNEDYEGGEINFPRYGLSIKPKAHDMVIFPAGYTFNHSVSTVTKGTRYCIVAWTK